MNTQNKLGVRTFFGRLTMSRPQIGSALVLAFTLPAGQIGFEVAPETRLERRIELTQYVEQTSYEATIDGVTRPSPLKLELATKAELVVRDDLRQVAEGRPTEVRRRFEKVSGSAAIRNAVGASEHHSSSAGTSPLEGVSVVYTWVPEEEDWGRYFDEKELDESLLLPMRQDLDALSFRPAGNAAVGDSWDLNPEAMRDLLAPAGDLAIDFDATEIGPFVRPLHVGIGARSHLGFDGALKGKLRASLEGTRLVEGVEYDVVSLEFELSSSADRSELYGVNLTFEEFRAGMRVNEAQTHWSAKGKGELFFASSGFLAKASIEGTQGFSLRWSGMLPAAEGKTIPISEESKFTGTMNLSLSASQL